MEHGSVTTVNYEDGVVYCDVRPVRFNEEYTDVPVMKPHSGFIQVPEQGETVAMHQLRDGTKFIGSVVSKESETPDDVSEGELTIYLDDDTKLSFTKRSDGNYDVDIGSSGQVKINGVPFAGHTHNYDDSTTESTSTKETTTPTQFDG
jgi:hypothetical protein